MDVRVGLDDCLRVLCIENKVKIKSSSSKRMSFCLAKEPFIIMRIDLSFELSA